MKVSKHRASRRRPTAIEIPPPIPEPAATGEAPSLPALVASIVTRLRLRERARVLQRLLTPVGPMALAVLGGGVFAKYAVPASWAELSVSLDDAASFSWSQVFELVRYVEQANPDVLQQLIELLSADATTMAALGASIAALLMQQIAARRNPRGAGAPGAG